MPVKWPSSAWPAVKSLWKGVRAGIEAHQHPESRCPGQNLIRFRAVVYSILGLDVENDFFLPNYIRCSTRARNSIRLAKRLILLRLLGCLPCTGFTAGTVGRRPRRLGEKTAGYLRSVMLLVTGKVASESRSVLAAMACRGSRQNASVAARDRIEGYRDRVSHPSLKQRWPAPTLIPARSGSPASVWAGSRCICFVPGGSSTSPPGRRCRR